MPVWLEHFAVAVCAISGVLAAAGRRLDLFGVLVLALVTAVGGGTIRDLCLGVQPVFWISNPSTVVTSTATALATFVAARFWTFPHRALLIADALGLALFTVVGVEKSLLYQQSGVIAVVLGVVTGVAGGMLRDVLLREVPLVFQPDIYLYATASICGAGAFVVLRHLLPEFHDARLVAVGIIFALRLAAIGWKIRLPVFESRHHDNPS